MTHYEANLSIRPLFLAQEGRHFGARLTTAAASLLQHFLAWRDRARSRRQLAGLNPRLLQDIGIDRATAQVESDKPFWQG